jgi:hypothetical protein
MWHGPARSVESARAGMSRPRSASPACRRSDACRSDPRPLQSRPTPLLAARPRSISDRPSDWFLRRIGAPESFVEPLDLYRYAKQRGLDFVTISDHNCIDGALEIAHLPDTFISNEVTTYFPEDGCKVHCLVSGITDRQFEDIQEVRHDIYERAPMPLRMRSPSLP